MSQKYDFEVGVYRPPSEGGSDSLLVRFTRNCPWNRCTFCAMYKHEKFQLRSLDEIVRDIDTVADICSRLKKASIALGHEGRITRDAAISLLNEVPELNTSQGFVMVFNWLQAGGKTAFIQDANSLLMKPDHLTEALRYLRKKFPTLARVTTYARSKTLAQRSLPELTAIREAGLDRVHIGLETGDDTLLKLINKGVGSEGHIRGGQKAMRAGFQVSEYWMPGLGGQALWEGHAENTARVLSAIDPHYIRSRPVRPTRGTPLYADYKAGEFKMLSPHGQLTELRRTMELLDFSGKVCFDHAGNYWRHPKGGYLFSQSYEGYRFPEQKPTVLALIDQGLSVNQSFGATTSL